MAIIPLEEGWNEIKAKIDMLTNMLNDDMRTGDSRVFGQPREYMSIYTTCYNMCTQRDPYNWSRALYQRHGETIESYLRATVLPALQSGSDGTILLKELQRRWSNHKIMNECLKKFFAHLDRCYVPVHCLPTVSEAGLRIFRMNIYDEVKQDATKAILELIADEREGKTIDKDLVKSIVELFVSMGMGSLYAYNADLEEPLLNATREFYSKKRQAWIDRDSTAVYLIKAEDALNKESERVRDYLNPSTESKLLKVCEEEILGKIEMVQLEKEGLGCRVLLATDTPEDLQRMFLLFSCLENDLDPMASIFENFISSMGNDVVNQRQVRLDSGEKDKNDDPTFLKSFISLHEKYLKVVKTDFSLHSLFQKALKDAFDSPTLSEAGLRNFRVIIYDEVKQDATTAILELIAHEREGKTIDKDLVKSIVELFVSTGMGSLDAYNADLEEPLLNATREFYSKKRQAWIDTDSTSEYLSKAEDALNKESERVRDYLNPSTESKLLKVCEEEILEKAEMVLLEKEGSGCRVLLANDKSEDLQRMFRLFSRVENGLDPMASIVENFISSRVNDVVNQRQVRLDSGEKDKNDELKFVKSLRSLHEKYLAVIKTDFSGHDLFQKALKDAFVKVVDKDVGQFSNAELMSTFCDRVLKSGGEKLSEVEVEHVE